MSERVDELAEADGIRGCVLQVAEAVDHDALGAGGLDGQTLTGELGRSPTPAELAERANATTEQILEALAAATAHRPDSLDQPLSDDGDDAIDFLAAREAGFERVE